jgi:hypothetical protein
MTNRRSRACLSAGEPWRWPIRCLQKDGVAASVMHFAKERVYDATELSRAVLKDFKLLE